jgi:uncharacterized protein (DUF1800 family)
VKLAHHHHHRDPIKRLEHQGVLGKSAHKRMTPAMVDRLFWRAGFGPRAADRAYWHNKKVLTLVDWLLTHPPQLHGAGPKRDGNPLDPASDDTDLALEWIDRMVRSDNPFVERMTFFWHRHFANSPDGGPSNVMLRRQIGLFRAYSSFFRSPTASFRNLLRDVTIDPSMLVYLTGEDNVKGDPNENYAREVMELFCLGITDAGNHKNYSENDVHQFAKAFTGWQVDDSNPDVPVSFFTRGRWYDGPKNPFGLQANYQVYQRGQSGYSVSADPLELILKRPQRVDSGRATDGARRPYETHARFLLTKLWSEFVVGGMSSTTMGNLLKLYLQKSGGTPALQLKPVLRRILTDSQLFSSISEPNMVKPPVVYAVGLMRSVGATVVDSTPADYLDAMGQLPYHPPNVAGWEGGLSWLNTNTVLSRFEFAGEMIDQHPPTDKAGESAAAALTRALGGCNNPWMASGTRNVLADYASRLPSSSPDLRIERQRILRALALAGPDGQVM